MTEIRLDVEQSKVTSCLELLQICITAIGTYQKNNPSIVLTIFVLALLKQAMVNLSLVVSETNKLVIAHNMHGKIPD